MAWVVVPALNALRTELDEVAPNRDRTSDGGIGDTSHTASPSGHNPDETGRPEDFDADTVDEVRARDFDADLRRPGLTMEMVVQHLVLGCRAGRITWIKYIIYRGRIWSASDGWVTRVYTGASRHDEHAHVSCKPQTVHEQDTRPVGLRILIEEDDMDLSTLIPEVIDSKTGQAVTMPYGKVLATMANRLHFLGNTLGLGGRLDELRALVREAIREAADDPALPDVPAMTDVQVTALADRLGDRLEPALTAAPVTVAPASVQQIADASAQATVAEIAD